MTELPIMTTNKQGTEEWRLEDGLLHRDDGPALVYENGATEWYQHGKLHRDGGPAMELEDGSVSYWAEGKLHRLDGPAVTHPDGTHEWHLEGTEFINPFDQ